MLNGIDVSTLQGVINWSAVKSGGVNFAMIKATQGRGEGAATRNLRVFTDSKFARNIVGAANAGIPCGVYHYMTAQTLEEAIEEADYFCEVISPYRDKITLWAAVDVESGMYLDKLSRAEITNITRTFINRIAAHGYKPMLYTNPNYITYRFLPNAFDDVDIWLAHYNVKTPKQVPRLQIWQYGVGAVAGVNANCDMNYGYFDVKTEPTVETHSYQPIEKGDTVKIKEYQIISGKKRAKLFNSNSTFVIYSDTYKVIGLNKQTGRAVISSNGITATAAVNVEILEKV